MAYGKLFESLYTGSMVGAGLNVFAVWTWIIANAKPPGTIEINPIILATVFGCSVQEVEQAIEKLCAPDIRSRTKDHQGSRLLREGEFLYSIPTWEKYNSIRNEIERRAQNRESQHRWRQGKQSKQSKPQVSRRKQSKPNESTSTSTSSPSEGESVERGEAGSPVVADLSGLVRPEMKVGWNMPCPEDVDPHIWPAYLAIRKSKRLIPSDMAIEGIRKKAAAAGLDLDTAIRHCIERSQVGFFPDEPNNSRYRR